ncbi:unnamed protein product [Commensalibacter communis]|uniref:Uncharacterized protein n=1 Tax=Commensalibacter communis TaxID=2972786 RepID=A0A9W4TSF5_9PROT|nr:hypothetical protein [Commensalibacter communis]CAI3948099.1 unnamed protein product [Commensalibacter communis]CAI3951312.1 unnamed protein product [Commensalibacter communis]CAI3951703.1 unnamed protein product [Commensalibacter communis]CAI3952441.1 unnamed protein product [Commensalibacter communis]CAI3953378.1 unnamed protein product [Commensalibacter communis]
MDSDLMMQCFQYLLGVIPGDIAGNMIAVVTTIVTICTLIVRFWKIPATTSKGYKLWKVIHTLASFKTPSVSKTENKDGQKIN